jgi:O-acetyl-ADP-ribose deacetylase (regulator of RNase III)
MIEYRKGNLLEAELDALVNTVNEVGVMGKGIALLFREAFPENTRAYTAACRAGEVRVGRMFVTRNQALTGPRWIINFPTKRHWRQPSRLEWIREGLQDLVRVLREQEFRSVALPPLGCGQGGLRWSEVRREIERGLAILSGKVRVVVYVPTEAYLQAPRQAATPALTPARALVAALVRAYGVLNFPCSLLEAQKLAWLLQRELTGLPENPLRELRFVAHTYGPYSDRLRHLPEALNGSFLRCERRIADTRPLDALWFDDAHGPALDDYLAGPEKEPYREALERVLQLIQGYQTPAQMELLATVGWLLREEGCEPTVADLVRGMERWPAGEQAAARKIRLFDEEDLGRALAHLKGASEQPRDASPAG